MTKINIIMPSGSWGFNDRENSFETALRVIAVAFGEAGDWNSKYGADVENDIFLMRSFCWCERDDCPWCTGCAAFQDNCAACRDGNAHKDECFIEELKRRHADYDESSGYNAIELALNAPGMMESREESDGLGFFSICSRRSAAGEAAHNTWRRAYEARIKAHEALTRALYKERGLKPSLFQWLCDCGAEKNGKAMRADGMGCDYHNGTGIFARFAPWTLDDNRRYYDPPNFWYKPGDFRVTWYKYIGRDMVSNKDEIPKNFMECIFETHPKKMTIKEAIALYEADAEDSKAAIARIMDAVNAR